MYEDEEYQSADGNALLFSDEEVIVQMMNDITELFKKYTYRFHPITKPTNLIITTKPYLDIKESYVKNIPVKISLMNGTVIYEATPDQRRFHKVTSTDTEINNDTDETIMTSVPINFLPTDETTEDPFE